MDAHCNYTLQVTRSLQDASIDVRIIANGPENQNHKPFFEIALSRPETAFSGACGGPHDRRPPGLASPLHGKAIPPIGLHQFGLEMGELVGVVHPLEIPTSHGLIDDSTLLQTSNSSLITAIQVGNALLHESIAPITQQIKPIYGLSTLSFGWRESDCNPSGQNLSKLTSPLDPEGPTTLGGTTNLAENITLDFVPRCMQTEATVHTFSGQNSKILTPPMIPEQ